MPWIDWPNDECGICGGSVQVETTCPQERAAIEARGCCLDEFQPPYCYDGDHCRCDEGHTGYAVADAETPVHFHWHDE